MKNRKESEVYESLIRAILDRLSEAKPGYFVLPKSALEKAVTSLLKIKDQNIHEK